MVARGWEDAAHSLMSRCPQETHSGRPLRPSPLRNPRLSESEKEPEQLHNVKVNRRKKMAITKQLFGRSGRMSSRTIFGAASLSHVTQQDADQTLQVLLQYGGNHIDVASS